MKPKKIKWTHDPTFLVIEDQTSPTGENTIKGATKGVAC
jgi:hypothetical protein